MKLIFLDVDGVLNRNSTQIEAPSGCMFVEDELVKQLRRIYFATHAKIVLSSTWRIGWYQIQAGDGGSSDAEDYTALAVKLQSFGIPINGYTPIMPDGGRGKEIERYLSVEGEVESFVVLDDISVDGFEDRQVKTNPKTGLSSADVKRAIEILNGQ